MSLCPACHVYDITAYVVVCFTKPGPDDPAAPWITLCSRCADEAAALLTRWLGPTDMPMPPESEVNDEPVRTN